MIYTKELHTYNKVVVSLASIYLQDNKIIQNLCFPGEKAVPYDLHVHLQTVLRATV